MKKKIHYLQIFIHIAGWLPLADLIFKFATNRLSVNPIEELTQQLGLIGVYFLVASLAVTPIYTLTGWRELPPRRRALGLYAFLYISLHVLIYIGLDYGFDFNTLVPLFASKVYLLMGILAFTLLIPLAVTSFDYFIRRMGKNWKRLHWLIYPSAIVTILHYGWSKKGNLFTLRGDVVQPFVWGMIVILLLAFRLPPVRKWVSGTRYKLFNSLRASFHSGN